LLSQPTAFKVSQMAQPELSPEGGPGRSLCGAWACLDVMELAGRLAQQHAQELKEVLRLPGDRANKARTQLHALAQALHQLLSIPSISDDEGRGGTGAMVLNEQCLESSSEELRRVGEAFRCQCTY
jgi:hypothetical protein